MGNHLEVQLVNPLTYIVLLDAPRETFQLYIIYSAS
jgi:hypothetical protein